MKLFEFSISNLIVVSTIVICFIVVKFIRDAGLNSNKKTNQSDKNSDHSFGLPAGTVRATLALVLIVFFVLLSLYSIGNANIDDSNQRLVSNILTTLATLVISAVSFYFGVKATEQGGEIATNIFNNLANKPPTESVPPSIIQEAISQKKSTWIKEFNCIDVRLGKKKTQDGQVDLDCLLFLVGEKKSLIDLEDTKVIPPTIQFGFKGKSYSIPTDVRPFSEMGPQPVTQNVEVPNIFENLDIEAQKGIITKFIAQNEEILIKKYPEIQGITEFKKTVEGTQKNYYAIQFTVAVKKENMSSADKIPPCFSFSTESGANYLIPTDVIEEGEILETVWHGIGESPKKLGLSISRDGSESAGTIGLKVFWEGSYHAMTCCHVLFRKETLEKPTKVNYSDFESAIISPGFKDKKTSTPMKFGNSSIGWYDQYLDIALAKLNDAVSLENKLFNELDNPVPSGVRILSENDNNITEVELFGRTSHRKAGKVYNYFQSSKFIGENNRKVDHLIVCELKSDPGDSGAILVVKSTRQIIGIVIATSDKFTYAIRIQKIINQLNLGKEKNPWLL